MGQYLVGARRVFVGHGILIRQDCFPRDDGCGNVSFRFLFGCVILVPILIAKGKAIAFAAGRSTQAAGPTVLGDLLVLLSMCAAAVSIVITKHLMTHYDSLQITLWMLNIGAALLLVGIECLVPVRFHFSLAVWGFLQRPAHT
jgi:hypothetical protein